MVLVGHGGRRLGVWVDHRQALVIDVSGVRASGLPALVERIDSGVEPLATCAAESSRGAAPMVISLEERRALIRRRQQLGTFYATIADAVADAERLVVMGPGIAAAELYDRLENDRRFIGALEAFERVDPRVREEDLVDLVRERVGELGVRGRQGAPNF